MRLLVVGAGATGGYFGGRLAKAGRDVTFLVRPARAAHLAAHGLQIISPNGDVTLTPQLVTAGAIASPYDVVLLTVKAYALHAALDDVVPAVGSQTLILPILNGMRHMDVLTARFGAAAVIGGVCKVAATIDEAGRIVQLAKFHELAYGELDGTTSARIKELDRFVQGAGFDAHLSTAITHEMWEKWLFLASLGAVTCLMRGTIGEITAAPGGADFVRQFVAEVDAVVKGAGVTMKETFLAEVAAALTVKGSPQASSMYRDLQNGNPIEADQIIGDLLVRGQKAGIQTPLIATVYAHLCVYQNRLAK
jgi:2-dehydropantoate 2-reductase